MEVEIRKAAAADVSAMVRLAAQRRRIYEQFQPVFWRPAEDADERQAAFFTGLLDAPGTFALVHEGEGAVDGYLIGRLVMPPPVYNPGGQTCVVDDFWISDSRQWPRIGTALLAAAEREGRERGAVQLVAVTAGADEPKRAMLTILGYGLASEWYVKDI
ncbi:MAG: GNAT family N-acetyltransferase [Symbiobacteriia bacterium]